MCIRDSVYDPFLDHFLEAPSILIRLAKVFALRRKSALWSDLYFHLYESDKHQARTGVPAKEA